jgi:hypothetical protein
MKSGERKTKVSFIPPPVENVETGQGFQPIVNGGFHIRKPAFIRA